MLKLSDLLLERIDYLTVAAGIVKKYGLKSKVKFGSGKDFADYKPDQDTIYLRNSYPNLKEYYKTDCPSPQTTKIFYENRPFLYYDFSKVKENIVYDLSGNGNHGILNGCSTGLEPISKIQHTILPYRNRPGRFFSQEHKRNDMVGGKWVHQKDTSVNEKRFVEEVQGGLIDTDEDGLTDLNYTIA